MTAVVMAAASLLAQPLSLRPVFDSFEVATVKPTPPDWKRGRYLRMQTARQFEGKNHTVKTLIAAAYNLSPKAIAGGPEWMDADHFDILAKTPGDVRPTLDEQMSMFRALLADRFKLRQR